MKNLLLAICLGLFSVGCATVDSQRGPSSDESGVVMTGDHQCDHDCGAESSQVTRTLRGHSGLFQDRFN